MGSTLSVVTSIRCLCSEPRNRTIRRPRLCPGERSKPVSLGHFCPDLVRSRSGQPDKLNSRNNSQHSSSAPSSLWLTFISRPVVDIRITFAFVTTFKMIAFPCCICGLLPSRRPTANSILRTGNRPKGLIVIFVS